MLTHTSEFWTRIGSVARSFFQKWDNCRIDNDELLIGLRDQGLVLTPAFKQLIEQHRRTRNLSYSVFMKALQNSHCNYTENLNAGASSPSARALWNKGLGNGPLSPSAKAPFGTAYTGGNGDDMDSFSEFSCSMAGSAGSCMRHQQRRHYAGVKGPDAFRSSLDERFGVAESESGASSVHVPAHLKSTINPLNGDALIEESDQGDLEIVHTHKGHGEASRAGTDHGDIITWHGNSPSASATVPKDESDSVHSVTPESALRAHTRRHYAPSASHDPMDWTAEPTPDVAPVAPIRRPTIVDHVEVARPATAGAIRRTNCPFATDADDLYTMRAKMHSLRLDKFNAPKTTAASSIVHSG